MPSTSPSVQEQLLAGEVNRVRQQAREQRQAALAERRAVPNAAGDMKVKLDQVYNTQPPSKKLFYPTPTHRKKNMQNKWRRKSLVAAAHGRKERSLSLHEEAEEEVTSTTSTSAAAEGTI